MAYSTQADAMPAMPDPMPELKMSGLGIQPNLGMPSGGPGNNQMSQANVDAGIKMRGMELQGKQQMADAQNVVSNMKLTFNPIDDTFDGKTIPGPVVRSLLESKQQVNEYQKLYNDMIADNLRKQQQMRDHPFQNTLAELAASFARNDPNPYTRAIGQAATRLNPSSQELQHEQRGLLKEAEGFAMRREAIDATMVRAMEGLDARQQANFTRKMAVGEAAVKNGNNSQAFYETLLKGLPEEERTALAADLAQRGDNVLKVKKGNEDWNRTYKLEDQKIRAHRVEVEEQAKKASQKLRQEQFNLKSAYGDGTKVNVPQMLSIKARLRRELNTLENNATKAAASLETRSADIETKYAGVKSLDTTGELGRRIDKHLENAGTTLTAGRTLIEQQKEALRDMIMSIDSSLPGKGGAAGAAAPEPAAAKPAPVKPGALDADDMKALDSGKQMQDPNTGLYYMKVGGKVMSSPVPFAENYREDPEEKKTKRPGVVEGTKKVFGQMLQGR